MPSPNIVGTVMFCRLKNTVSVKLSTLLICQINNIVFSTSMNDHIYIQKESK